MLAATVARRQAGCHGHVSVILVWFLYNRIFEQIDIANIKGESPAAVVPELPFDLPKHAIVINHAGDERDSHVYEWIVYIPKLEPFDLEKVAIKGERISFLRIPDAELTLDVLKRHSPEIDFGILVSNVSTELSWDTSQFQFHARQIELKKGTCLQIERFRRNY